MSDSSVADKPNCVECGAELSASDLEAGRCPSCNADLSLMYDKPSEGQPVPEE